MSSAHPIEPLASEVLVDWRAAGVARYIIGIAGCPGAGKSTLAQALIDVLNGLAGREVAAFAPLDGFLIANEILDARGILPLKGIPASFDADAYIERLTRLRASPPTVVTWPRYDRAAQRSIPDAITIRPDHGIIVTEGNYLLLADPPWDRVRPLLDSGWYLDAERAVIEPRLLVRHIGRGLSPADAARKVASTDLPNAILVEASRPRADRIVNLPDDPALSPRPDRSRSVPEEDRPA